MRGVLCECCCSSPPLLPSPPLPSPHCRPIRSGPATTGRGVMSIYGLSHGVVRVEEAGAMTSLTLQDVGLVMPGGGRGRECWDG